MLDDKDNLMVASWLDFMEMRGMMGMTGDRRGGEMPASRHCFTAFLKYCFGYNW